MGNTRVNKKLAAMKQSTLAAVYAPTAGWLMFASKEVIEVPNLHASNSVTAMFSSSQPTFTADPVYLQVCVFVY